MGVAVNDVEKDEGQVEQDWSKRLASFTLEINN